MSFGKIVIVGGGCYGTFYARQLAEAKARGKTGYDQVLVVDRDPRCRMANELGPGNDRELVVSEWDPFFDRFLEQTGGTPERPHAIVPSPLMPHLMYDWLLRRARHRWPNRLVETRALNAGPGTPYDRAAPDRTRYVSWADWLCPTHCVEPATCPVTRAPRTWEMADTIGHLARRLDAEGPVLFQCEHQVFGVGMFMVGEVLEGDRRVREVGGRGGPADIVVGTISSCHGALNLLHIGPA